MRTESDGRRGAVATEPDKKRELKLSAFEGPLDLLLHLIERENFDITAISLVEVADQYLRLLHADEELDAAALAEFVVIGSKLIYLKSRALLPRTGLETEAPEDEVAADLTQALEQFRRYKEAARLFREREEMGLRAYTRQAPAPAASLPSGLDGVTAAALLRILRQALSRQPKEAPTPLRALERDPVTLGDKVATLRRALQGRGVASFRRLIRGCRSRVEVIVQFLAVLELIKAGELVARQDALFADIELVTPEVARAPSAAADETGEAIA